MSLESRFWSKVRVGGPDECWEWAGSRTLDGYGHIQVDGRKSLRPAHRVAFELANGIPVGSLESSDYVCHSCDNPPCVNPSHLWLGTARDNVADMVSKGRKRPAKGASHGMARLADAQVLAIAADPRPAQIVARIFGVSKSCIEDIKYGRTWRHLTQREEGTA